MRFSVLGPLEVLDRDGVAVVVRGSKVRTVLAMLVMRAGEPATTGQLCDAVWGDDPPATAANALQAHMSKLRRLLEPGMLENRDGSYSLALTGSTVDASEFSELATAGHEQLGKGNTKLAVTTLRQALALWRGEPLSDIDEAEFWNVKENKLLQLLKMGTAAVTGTRPKMGEHAELKFTS